MKLRTQLIGAIVVFAILLGVISLFIFSTNQELDRLLVQEEIAGTIAIEAGELGYLSDDFILYREPGQEERWIAQYNAISDRIQSLSIQSPEEQAIAESLASDLRSMRSIFDDIAAEKGPGAGDAASIRLAWSRIAVLNQGMSFDANRLATLLHADEEAVEQQRLVFFIALVALVGAFLLSAFLFFYLRTLRSIAALQEGARIIGSGNLGHAIEQQSDDEIGELAGSFNRMTADLRSVTASKSELEQEVAARKRAEEELVRANEALSRTGEELTRKNTDLSAMNEELTAIQEELQQNVEELQKNETRLREAVAERDALLSEIHHRVKNNLAAFISLLSLEGSHEPTEKGIALKTDLQNRARSMALIHETLYRTGQFSSVDMESYLTTLVSQIAQSYARPGIRTRVEAPGIVLDLARATTAGLIVNELVTNSLKYAFPSGFDCMAVRGEPCTITVTFSREDGNSVLSVADNGTGLPADFDPLTAKSLGLRLVNFLSGHQLHAEISVRTDRGTEFVFRLRNRVQ